MWLKFNAHFLGIKGADFLLYNKLLDVEAITATNHCNKCLSICNDV